jgi:hypothetical protein
MTSEPESSTALAAVSCQASHEGIKSQPRRIPGARRFEAEPHVEHAFGREALQRADRSAVVAKLAVEVVLDDQPLPALGPLDQRRSALGAEHRSGGKLVSGGDHHDVGVALRELLDAQSLGVDRDRHDLQARLLDDQLVRVPAGILQRDRAHAVAAQRPAGEREALREAGADQHVLGVRGRAADAPQVVGERFAQLRNAARVAVSQSPVRRGA